MKVVGLDLSLTSTGVATVYPDQGRVLVDRIQTGAVNGTVATLRRLRLIRYDVMDLCRGADLAVIELPAYSSKTGKATDRAGMWWMTLDDLEQRTPIAVVTTGGVKKYATGSGNAPKDKVLAAVVRRYLDVDVTGNDEADALVLAAMGARALGHPIEKSLPKNHLEAMAKVEWPESVELDAATAA